ncbi:MAG: xanthine dehydrogenase family protein molybdopterin-binding subunit [Conexivisphaerales archaeon]
MEAVAVAKREEMLVGKALKRAEDVKFITGKGHFIDDIQVKDCLWAAFVRSPHPHAKIISIKTERALSLPGVVAVLTAEDMNGKVGLMPTLRDDKRAKPTTRTVLAEEFVRYEGEPVAVVLASDRYTAEDAKELVDVEYQPLEAVTDPEKALQKGSPLANEEVADNIGYQYGFETPGFQKAFSNAERIVKIKVLNQRVAPSPLEGRGVVAVYDEGQDLLTVYLTTQDPFESRRALAEVLKRPAPSIRIIAPDIGGAFGSKISIYPEEAAVSFAAIQLKKPVRWSESRRENLLTTTHGRGQVQYAEAALDKEGRIVALNVRIISDTGAYVTDGSVYTPRITPQMVPGVYDIKEMKAELICAMTNKVPQDAYRGAGRPEATYLIERLVNRISRELKVDPVEVRMKNFIPSNRFPYRNASGRLTYDSGNYAENLLRALKLSDYYELKKEKERLRREGRLIGIGMATYVEVCAFSPDYPQTASVTVTPEGKVIINSGTTPHGQGHATPFAQIVSDVLGVDLNDVYFNFGDTASLPYATITAGSRSAAIGGSAVLLASQRIRSKMNRIAAKILGTDEKEELQFSDGWIFSKIEKDKRISFAEVAQAAYTPSQLPEGMEPTLYEYVAYAPKSNAFPFGTHIAAVEVDPESFSVKLLKYFAVDDIGRVLNPLIAEGQVHGGVAQGAGQALLEAMAYDENGSCLTSSYMDYLLPDSTLLPEIVWERTETGTDANLLGLKGVGETGAIAATPAVANAVEDALSDMIGDKDVQSMPLLPSYLWGIGKADG